jgi:tRNA 2-selenouridine synthase
MHITIHEAIRDFDRFDAVIDVRSPDEWTADRLPGAINLPVLSNQERAEIGKLHAESSFAAKKRGAVLVARNIATALETNLLDMPRQWRPLIYCWRGGNRSQAMATVLERIGWKPALLTGGYTAFRRYVVEDLTVHAQRLRYQIICGVTGSGKSLFLRQAQRDGRQVLDLEALAHHRGSLLGSEPTGTQPSQKAFETKIWDQLRKMNANESVLVESESKKIGALQVPAALISQMRTSECIELCPSLEDRVAYLLEGYAHFFDQPDVLMAQLERLAPLVGLDRISQWQDSIRRKCWAELVTSLLTHHYDPTYHRSMRKNYSGYAQAKKLAGHPMHQTLQTAAA